MKIWFRIGPDRGSEQDGQQPLEHYRSAHSTVRFLDPFTLLALTKDGNIYEGSRFSGARLLQAQPVAPTPLLSRQHRAKSSAKLGENDQFSDESNRNWPKKRSCRKQTSKPCLTGAKLHIVARASRAILRRFTPLAPTRGRSFHEGECFHVTRCLNRGRLSRTCNFRAFLPGSGQKVEIIENKPLNPFYPVLELHNVSPDFCTILARLLSPPWRAPLRPPPASWRTSAIADVCYPCRGDTHEWVTSIASRVI
jgi:hypothetical protein